ncbi:hypothetical protein ACK318_07970 [Aeromonas dhakensis]|uniref:hypothetical protein n=1 Tax=Aeromonas dhakensis TaxID=196024 RepID=UPI002E377121|nr:hypothetical protein [Aeromonas dhakensis]MED7770872.1 hypothetical protein [Aeromonas dhakensis]
MMLLVVALIASSYFLSGWGRLADRRFVCGSSLMLLYLALYYFFPSDIVGGSISLGRLGQYLPVLSYAAILFGEAAFPFNNSRYIPWIGVGGLIASSFYHIMFFVI